jgi:PKHD-type hydroxylase
LIIAALNNCISWRSYVTAPKATSEILYLKYDKDSLYKYHADVSKGLLLGAIHYANTLFLNEPEEYEGGELVLTINQEAIPYKLKKNTLLTYPVGLKHSVNTITKGTRKVAVFWTESYITNNEDRETIRELEAMSNNLLKVLNDKNKSIKVKNQNIKNTLIDLARVSELVQSKYPRLRDPLCPLISD